MGERTLLFECECQEPKGVITRRVYQSLFTLEKLRSFYMKLSRFDTLFNSYIENNFASFLNIFISQDQFGCLHSSALVWEVDDIGLLYMTDIRPAYEAAAHFTFWDGRIRGRGPLLREAAKFAFEHFHFHRVTTELPLYVNPSVFKIVEDVGFVKEGRKRKSVLYKGQWYDTNLYSLLSSEV